ncbi:hypothetical protein G6F65_017109 [Rhizopus arrhizus]|nr:hypothetical protein G6F65_017109 [Rhizopus arrhizus]
MTGTGADVQHHLGLACLQVVQRLDQPRLHLALQGGGGVIAVGGTGERAADVAGIEVGRHCESLLERTGVGAAVDQQVLPGEVTGLYAAQEGAGGAEFVRRAEAAGGNLLAAALGHFAGVAILARTVGEVGAQAVGVELAGQQVVDGDVVGHGAARQAGDEAGQATARTVGQRQDVDRGLHRRGGDVDDAAKAAIDHRVHGGADHCGNRPAAGHRRW